MRLYVASKYPNKELIRDTVVPALEDAGHEVVSSWHLEKYEPGIQVSDVAPPQVLGKLAKRDIREIEAADALLVIARRCRKTRGGMWVEMGYALGRGKAVFNVGPKVTLFHWLRGRVTNFDSLSRFLEVVPA